jgi:hypothetical protein
MARLISSKAVYQCHNRRNELVSICICASKINQRENPDGEDIWNWYNKNDAEGIRKSIIQGADPNFCGPVIVSIITCTCNNIFMFTIYLHLDSKVTPS